MREKAISNLPGVQWDQPNGNPIKNAKGAYYRTGKGVSGHFRGFWVAEVFYGPNQHPIIRMSYPLGKQPGSLLSEEGGDLLNLSARALGIKYEAASVDEHNVRLNNVQDPVVALRKIARWLRSL